LICAEATLLLLVLQAIPWQALYSVASVHVSQKKRMKIRSQGIQLLAGQQARMTIACGGSHCILSQWAQKKMVSTFSIKAVLLHKSTMSHGW
jgi:hypothetical protein